MSTSPRAGPVREDARGTTLIELLVVATLAGIVLPIVFVTMLATMRSSQQTIGTVDHISDVRLGLALVDKTVRFAHQPLAVSTTSLQLNTCLIPDGASTGTVETVEFRVEAGALQSRSYPYGTAPGAWATQVTGLSSASGFEAVGARSVRVRLTVDGADPGQPAVVADGALQAGRAASVTSVFSPRNGALPTPIGGSCP